MALLQSLIALLKRIPQDLVALVCRFGVGMVFWLSGRTKVEGWNIFDLKASQKFLFTEVHPVPGVSWEVAAQLAALGEHLFPLLLFIGLGTRFAAVALLGMTIVIQVALPTGFPTHLLWAGVLLYLMAQGPGRVSVDHVIATRRRQRSGW